MGNVVLGEGEDLPIQPSNTSVVPPVQTGWIKEWLKKQLEDIKSSMQKTMDDRIILGI
ncbi:MAG TPA: hypothetical protein VGW78_07230 [Candidatus Babeliales bacterium]|nr:hypothetical protein [Candidatus Babeliales bacterium]